MRKKNLGGKWAATFLEVEMLSALVVCMWRLALTSQDVAPAWGPKRGGAKVPASRKRRGGQPRTFPFL